MKLFYPLAKRFIAGHDFDSAKPVIADLMAQGYGVTIDYLGELSKTIDDCEKATKQYLDIIEYYKNSSIDISIKPTQIGLKLDREKCFELLLKITSQARQYGITIRLDMEDFSVTQDTIDMCLRIWKKNPNIGIALQSNLYRTTNDLPKLMSRGISIRLIKGAYKEDITKSYQQNNLKVKSFLRLAQTLLSNNGKSYFHYLNNVKHAIGTHDETIIKSITTQLPVFKVKPTDFQFELLYGIRRDISFSLLKEGYNVTLYIPFGEEWLPYTLRRLKEFKNLRFVIFNILKELFSGNRQRKSTR
jgi:proline dehydrogenase